MNPDPIIVGIEVDTCTAAQSRAIRQGRHHVDGHASTITALEVRGLVVRDGVSRTGGYLTELGLAVRSELLRREAPGVHAVA